MIDYKYKYLKYKIKYLNLLDQIGGKCSHPFIGKKKTALELTRSGCYDYVELYKMFKDSNEAKTLGFRFKELNTSVPLDKIVYQFLNHPDKASYSKPLESLKRLDYFEGVEISEWLRSLIFSDDVAVEELLQKENYLDKNGRITGFVPNIEKDKNFYKKYNFDKLLGMFGFTIKQLLELGHKIGTLYESNINWKKYDFTVKELFDLGFPGERLQNYFYVNELEDGGYSCNKGKREKTTTCR